LNLRAWVGDLDAPKEADREAYQPITVIISGLLWCIVESPDAATTATDGELWIDAGPVASLKEKPAIPTVPDGAFAWWIVVRQWNAFIYIAGMDASFGE